MTLRKITIDNSFKYIPQNEKTIRAGSLPLEQIKNISQNIKKNLENIAASGYATVTKYCL